MNKIKIITDSTNDLGRDLLEKHDIAVIPLHVNFNDDSFDDGINITTTSLYEKVKEYNMLPKTAAITIMEFINFFETYLNQGYDIIYTGISKALSSTYNNAKIAANELDEDRISVIDSMNLSTGIGLNLLRIAKLRDEGKSLEEITNDLLNYRLRVKSQFVIPTLDYLYKGGRCSSLTNLVGKVFKIKPIIEVRNGKMSVGPKPRGKMINALNILLNMIKQDLDNLELENVFVTHSLNETDAKYLVDELKKFLPAKINLYTTCAGCVISSHCGKDTIGILYVTRR